jgi:hypothetical protein
LGFIVGCGLGLGAAGPAAAEKVDLELVLAVDVSGSMDRQELEIQRDGYVAALAHPEVVRAIRGGYAGKIAIVYVEWAGPGSQVVTVPWTAIHDAASAQTFADAVAAAPLARIRGTSISGSLAFTSGLFDANGFEGTRRVIDISGDCPNNMGVPVEPVRDRVIAKGIVINGLTLLIRPSLSAAYGGFGLDDYYRDCVIGGPGAFVVPVREMARFAEAVRRKLVFEIAGLPPRVISADFRPTGGRTDCLIGEKLWGRWMQDRE